MIAIVPRSELAAQDERTLAEGLAHYYSASPAAYYALTEEGGTEYTSRLRPFHADLVSRVRPGMSVLEVGCGAAHLCRYVEQAGGRYTGVDHGLELLQKNRERYRSAHFLPVGAELHGHFDLVASLYTIEHVVNPLAYLETMWQACTPGGILAVICPDFVDGAGLPPSIFFGTTPRRLRDKVKEMAIGDAIGHLRDLVWSEIGRAHV